MKNYPIYTQTNPDEVQRFVEEMSMCFLSSDGINGVFNPLYKEGEFYFHLNRTDEQFKKLEETNTGTLIFFEFLCNIPSYWVDPVDGGVATSYYRYAEFNCEATIYKERNQLAAILPLFLEKYQPEGQYEKLTETSELYQSDYKTLGIVKLTPKQTIAKWKMGQNRPIEKRCEIIQKLKERNNGLDLKAVAEIERWISIFQK